MSAQTVLNGIYPPQGYQKWRENLSWQPIPVHTTPKDADNLLGLSKCKYLGKLQKEDAQSKNSTATTRKYKVIIISSYFVWFKPQKKI